MAFDLPVPTGYMSITEVARSARVSRRTVERWLAAGILTFSVFSKRRYVHYADLDSFVRNRDERGLR